MSTSVNQRKEATSPSTLGREIDGRIFNDQSDIYMLPADSDEFKRLNKQHHALKLALDGLYPCRDIVNTILDPLHNASPKVLDLGCGSGIWAREMALQFPHASVLGIDLTDAKADPAPIPPNCSFEIHDINKGLSKYAEEKFDFITARCIGGGISSFATMMQEAEACLKPGGLVIFMDGDMTLYAEDMVSPITLGLDPEEGGDPAKGSWMARLARETRYAAAYTGADVDGLDNCIDNGVWDHPLLDPATVQVASLFTPIGAWATDPDPRENKRLQLIGTLIGQDFARLASAWSPLLKQQGLPQARVSEWSSRAKEEIEQVRFRVCMHWRLTWGRRLPVNSTTENTQVPSRTEEIASNAVTANDGSSTVDHSAAAASDGHFAGWYRVYNTKGEADQVAGLRKEARKHLPVALVDQLRQQPTSVP